MKTTLRARSWTGRVCEGLLVVVAALAVAACARPGREGEADGGNGNGNGSGDGAVDPGDGGLGDGGGPDAAACAVASDEPATQPVDIIIAIDQSASMGEERQGVEDNINTNLAAILEASGLDYRVILIQSGFCMQPPLGNPADCTASNPPRYYNVPHPVNSSDALTIFLWSFEGWAKTPNTCDRTFNAAVQWSDKVRPGALKVFIAVTDDDPVSFSAASLGCSDCPMHQCPTFADSPADWPGGQDFPTELYALPGGVFGTPAEPQWVFHSIIGVDQPYDPSAPVTPLNQTCAYNNNTAETSGVEYQKLSRLTGGLRFPSCDTDYSPVFQEIASTIVPLACEFLLSSTSLGQIDPGETNVEWDPMDGSGATTIYMDDSAPCDAGANGWQWNEDFTRIRLCGPACDAVQATPTGRVSIVVGCRTLTRR